MRLDLGQAVPKLTLLAKPQPEPGWPTELADLAQHLGDLMFGQQRASGVPAARHLGRAPVVFVRLTCN
jgi:hypothetical protein